MKRDNLKRQRTALCTKVSLLRAKRNSCENTYKIAHQTYEDIQRIMPIVLRKKIALDSIVENEPCEAIKATMNTLNEFYAALDATEASVCPEIDLNHPIWISVQENFVNIPNHLIWNSLNRLSGDNHKALMQLANLVPISSSDKTLKMLIVKLQAKQLSAFISTSSHKKEFNLLEQQFIDLYDTVTEQFNLKMDLLNDTTYDESIVNEYLSEVIINMNTFGDLEYLEKYSNGLNAETVQLHKELENYLVIIDKLRELYKSSEQMYKLMQNNRFALRMIKEKMDYMMAAAQRLCNDVELKNKKTTINVQHNNSSISFDSLTDSVLCSTKLESSVTVVR